MNLIHRGARVRLVGFNKYDLAFGPEALKCPLSVREDVYEERLISLLTRMRDAGANTIRLWAYQSSAGADGTDYRRFEHVLAKAKELHLFVIPVLEDHWDYCTNPKGAKTPDWYAKGYALPSGYALSYREYVANFVAHFRNEPAIAAWQLMNEMESTDASALRTFASDMAALVKSIDRTHLLSLGTIGCGQDGTRGKDYALLHQDPNVDLIEAHDYNSDAEAMPRCIEEDLLTARELGKPFVLGEVGVAASADRAKRMEDKLRTALQRDVAGFLIWQVVGDKSPGDKYSVRLNDDEPIRTLFHRVRGDEAP